MPFVGRGDLLASLIFPLSEAADTLSISTISYSLKISQSKPQECIPRPSSSSPAWPSRPSPSPLPQQHPKLPHQPSRP